MRRVGEVMTVRVDTIREWEEIGLSSDLMAARKFRHMPVLDAHGHVVGMLSNQDLLEAAARPGNPRLRPVYDVMTRPPITIGADASLAEAVERMHDHQIHALPVVDDEGLLVGIVSDTDLLVALAGADTEPERVRVDELMLRAPARLSPVATIAEARARIGDAPCVFIDDDRGRLLGLLPRALLETESLVPNERLPLEQLLERPPPSVRSGTQLRDALETLASAPSAVIAVIDEEARAIGVLPAIAVIEHLRRPGAAPSKAEAPMEGDV